MDIDGCDDGWDCKFSRPLGVVAPVITRASLPLLCTWNLTSKAGVKVLLLLGILGRWEHIKPYRDRDKVMKPPTRRPTAMETGRARR